MKQEMIFLLNSILLGVGLAMDAFSVSLANGLNEPEMPKKKEVLIAGTFCFFQILMPMIGWFLVHTVAEAFLSFQKWIPWIALILLSLIGGKMILEGVRGGEEKANTPSVGIGALMLQGIATSIDALSVGFTIAGADFPHALTESVIIGLVTYGICAAGLILGKKFGTGMSKKASVLGGCILIGIGLEILLRYYLRGTL